MALALTFSVEERNDNKVITVTDTTGVYNVGTNPTGWGAPNPAVTDIDGNTHTLELIVTVTTSDNTETTYDAIDLYNEFGPFATTVDLVFDLNCSMLLVGSIALGTASDEFPDGIYELEYIYDNGLGTEKSVTTSVVMEGIVRNATSNLLREIPTIYTCKDCSTKQVLDAMFAKALLDSIRASAYVAQEEKLLRDLAVLERIVVDGSNYNW